jgi:cellulose synthase/poly-beta-1,6-N-acetylglucosamine synthase-like glycosyltransferase
MLIALVALAAPVGLYALYLLWHARAFVLLNPGIPRLPEVEFLPLVSVIIPARNEAATVGRCLRALIQQTYPPDRLEVILVDDHSSDGTLSVADAYKPMFRCRVEVVRLEGPQGNAQKKNALREGITHSTGDVIMTTDADCEPEPTWVAAMVATLAEQQADLVSGPVRKRDKHHRLFEKAQALESAGMVALGAAAISMGHPTLANGGNLAFRRIAYTSVNGYDGIDHVASGDDELLMHKIHRWGGRLVFAKLRSATVDTDALRNLRAFRHQRVRWVSKARAYNNLRMQAGQLVSYLAFLGVLVLGVWAALDAEPLVTRVFIGALVVKIFAEACMLLPALSFLQQLRLSWLIVPVQPFYILYVLWVGVAGTLSSGYEWKGRRVH